ncbi:hypothetical protein D3C71_2179350 [compost metagenome]
MFDKMYIGLNISASARNMIGWRSKKPRITLNKPPSRAENVFNIPTTTTTEMK